MTSHSEHHRLAAVGGSESADGVSRRRRYISAAIASSSA